MLAGWMINSVDRVIVRLIDCLIDLSIDQMIYHLINYLSVGFFLTAQPVNSWNITVNGITSSTAWVRWSNFPLPLNISHYFVRYKDMSNGVSTLFKASSSSNKHYVNRLKGYTSYDVQVLAASTSTANITYSSQMVSIETAEGGRFVDPLPSHPPPAPTELFVFQMYSGTFCDAISIFYDYYIKRLNLT